PQMAAVGAVDIDAVEAGDVDVAIGDAPGVVDGNLSSGWTIEAEATDGVGGEGGEVDRVAGGVELLQGSGAGVGNVDVSAVVCGNACGVREAAEVGDKGWAGGRGSRGHAGESEGCGEEGGQGETGPTAHHALGRGSKTGALDGGAVGGGQRPGGLGLAD